MENKQKESSAHDENLRMAYEQVANSFRFTVSLRFIVAAFATTLQSALLTLYSQLFQQTHLLGRIGIVTLPFVGLIVIWAVFLIEQRTIGIYHTLLQLGTELDFQLGLGNAHFRRITAPGPSNLTFSQKIFSHTVGIRIIYLGIVVTWISLLILSIVEIY